MADSYKKVAIYLILCLLICYALLVNVGSINYTSGNQLTKQKALVLHFRFSHDIMSLTRQKKNDLKN